MMNELQVAIAKNFAALRKQRGLSLDKVSELTGVSKAMLAQIEKAKSNPSVSTLWKIATGLNVSFSTFTKDALNPQIEKVQINQSTPVIDHDGQYLVHPIFPYHPEKKFEIFSVTLKPGHSQHSNQHIGEEYILVQKGRLVLELQGEQHVMTENEAIRFQSNINHVYRNSTDEPVCFYNLIYYHE